MVVLVQHARASLTRQAVWGGADGRHALDGQGQTAVRSQGLLNPGRFVYDSSVSTSR